MSRLHHTYCSAMFSQGAKSKYMMELQKERDTLAKEKTALLQKLAAVTQAGAEERKRLEQTYKDKLTSVERRLKDLADREKAAKRSAAQLVSAMLSSGDPDQLHQDRLCFEGPDADVSPT